jgi:DNA-binding CsgD family transcriptional regulator
MNIRILIIHQSAIVAEGLQRLLQSSSLQLHDHLRIFNDPADIFVHSGSNYIFITSPALFQILYKNHLINFPEVNYRYIQFSTQVQSPCDNSRSDTINLDDSQDQIIEKVRSTINSFNPEKNNTITSLTERETEVLKLVSLGNASKEIADKLNISTHTVITHRKNITEKLGIKSISGLTLYAILNKIIDTDELSIDDLI